MAAARTHRIPPQGGLEEPVRAFLLQKFVLKKPKESNLLDTYSCILRSTKAQRASSMAAAERITFNGMPENYKMAAQDAKQQRFWQKPTTAGVKIFRAT